MATDALARLMGSGRRGGGGGGSNPLPPVTDADNGDVLMVVDGAWDKAKLPKDIFIIEIVDDLGKTDKTGVEIYAAYESNKIILVKWGDALIVPRRVGLLANIISIEWNSFRFDTNYCAIVKYQIGAPKDSTNYASKSQSTQKLAYYVET